MSRTRRKWTPAEDQILIEAMTRANRSPQPLAWHLIAQSLKHRTNKDCRKRWHSKLAADVNKGPWLPDEDSRLYDAVQTHGSKWVLVASQVGTRNGDQCSKRWNNTMNPDIDHTSWLPHQDELLVWAVGQLGHNWTKIVSAHFFGRTPLAAKNRYHVLSRKLRASLGINSALTSPSLRQDSDGESGILGSNSDHAFADNMGHSHSAEFVGKETHSNAITSNEDSQSSSMSRKGESTYPLPTHGYPGPQQARAFVTPIEDEFFNSGDCMIGNVGLNCPSASSSGSFSLGSGRTLEDVPLPGAVYIDPSFQRSSQDDRYGLDAEKKPSQTMHRHCNLAGLGKNITGRNLVQSSSPRETCDNATRKVTITAICSADQLGNLLQVVTERTISAHFETGS